MARYDFLTLISVSVVRYVAMCVYSVFPLFPYWATSKLRITGVIPHDGHGFGGEGERIGRGREPLA